MTKIGVLLTNTGTPDAPTREAVREHLREFLSDKRVVHIPHIIWLPILYGLILPLRSKKSTELYKKIWTPEGSPQRVNLLHIAKKLQDTLPTMPIVIGMNYGNPSIPEALNILIQQGVERVVVLPLFPQYSHTTTASSFDRIPDFQSSTKISHYHANPAYIEALANSIKQH